MSRVFVSSAYRDRAVGRAVSGLLRDLGDEPVDDRGDASGTAWWNEVVGRIETCEMFVAVVSPAYAEAHACRLAAKHAAAKGLPVVRLDVSDRSPTDGLHPVVGHAPPVRFDADDPGAPAVLDRALDQALDGTPEGDRSPGPADDPDGSPPAVQERPTSAPSRPDPHDPAHPPDAGGRFDGLEVAVASVLVLLTLALLVVVGPAFVRLVDGGGGEDPVQGDAATTGGGKPSTGTSSAPSTPSPASVEPSGAAASADAETDAAQQLLSTVSGVPSNLLLASSCTVGDGRVTCRRPATNIETVVLTPYSSPEELYDAYSDAVGALAGEAAPENVGDCSGTAYEGEFAWDLDLGHTQDIPVAEQAAGGLDPATEAAGRLFCTESSDVVRLVWTQDPGLLATATGQPAKLTIGWWHDAHLALACAAGRTSSGCDLG